MVYEDSRMKTSELKFRNYMKMTEKDNSQPLNATTVGRSQERNLHCMTS